MEPDSTPQSKVDFKINNYFPATAVGMGYSGVASGLFLILAGNVGIGVFFLLVAVSIIIPINGLEIDIKKKEFNTYVTFLGFRKNDIRKFGTIECVFIQRALLSARGPYSDDVLTGDDRVIYNAYLKFSKKDKIHIAREGNKKKIIKKCMVFSSELNVELFDCTSGVQVSLT